MSQKQPEPQNKHQVPLPDELSVNLDFFKKKLWRIKIAEAILAGVFGLILSFLIIFALDRFWETPTSVRLVTFIVGVSLFTIFAPYWIHRWVYGHRRDNQIARLISKQFPHLGDRLLGAVELQDQSEETECLSPELRSAAMREVAEEIARRDLNLALPPSRHYKWAIIVAVLLLLSIITFTTSPQASGNALKRWLFPMSETPRYTSTKFDLSNFNTPHYVAYGEPFILKAPLAENTNRSPNTARARYGKGQWVQSSLKNNAYTFEIPAQRSAQKLQIEAGDALQRLQIEPVMRPSLKSIRASIKLPEYLERGNTNADIRSGFITVLEGSHVTIQAKTSRKLKSASANIIQVLEPENIDLPAPEPVKPEQVTLSVADTQFTSAPFVIGETPIIVPIEWLDVYNLKPNKTLKLRIESTRDQRPTSYLQGVNRQHIMLAGDTLDLTLLNEDDYGLKNCGIAWSSDLNTQDTSSSGELALSEGAPTKTNLETPFAFSPANLKIQPQKLYLRSWAEDYKPNGERAYSEPSVIFILTPEEHAQVLKADFDKITAKLEEIAREEQNLNDENKRLSKKSEKELQNDLAQKKLQDQQNSEKDNTERMQKLNESMESLFKDAVRNGEIDKETLKKMSQAMQTMKEVGDKDLPQVEKKLQEAQNNSEQAKEKLNEAIEKQDKALEKMKQAIQQARDAKKNFEAGNFIARLKKAARNTNNTATSFISMIDQVIGQSFGDLDPVEQRSINDILKKQTQTSADIRWIKEDLTHYYARTQQEKHKELADAMNSSIIDESLRALSANVEKNISFKSIQESKKWAKQLAEWAKQLEGNKNEASGGGGDGAGGASQEDQDFEFMLKVMRMIQKEQEIRGRTRALEDLYRNINKDQTPKKIKPATPAAAVTPSISS